MSPQQAINILQQVEQTWVANGQDHQNFLLAINILEGIVVAHEAQNSPKESAPTGPADVAPSVSSGELTGGAPSAEG